MVFVFLLLTYFTQCDNLQLHTRSCKQHYFVLSSVCVCVCVCVCVYIYIYIYIYDTSSLSFISQWTFRFSHVLAIMNSVQYEHWGAWIFLNYSFVQIYTQEWDSWIIWQLQLQFSEEPPYCSPQRLCQLVCTNSAGGLPFLHTFSSIVICKLFNDGHSDQCEMVPHCSFDFHFSHS